VPVSSKKGDCGGAVIHDSGDAALIEKIAQCVRSDGDSFVRAGEPEQRSTSPWQQKSNDLVLVLVTSH
jgi:hypothetical protein